MKTGVHQRLLPLQDEIDRPAEGSPTAKDGLQVFKTIFKFDSHEVALKFGKIAKLACTFDTLSQKPNPFPLEYTSTIAQVWWKAFRKGWYKE